MGTVFGPLRWRTGIIETTIHRRIGVLHHFLPKLTPAATGLGQHGATVTDFALRDTSVKYIATEGS